MRPLPKSFAILMIGLLYFFLITAKTYAQDSTFVDGVRQRDVYDVLFPKKERKVRIDTLAPKDVELTILPYVGFGPATGVEIGVSGNSAFYIADRTTTRQSLASLSTSFTLKKQLFITSRSVIFTKNNKWILVGDQRFNKNIQSTFGLGTNTTEDTETPLRYKLLRFSEIAFYHLGGSVYVGGGFHYDQFYSIKLEDESQSSTNNPYINYTNQYNFDPERSVGSGFSLNALYDTRDNLLNTYKGIYALANYRIYPKSLGSSANWQEFKFEFRNYQSLSINQRHRLAIWIYADFIVEGNAPYLNLPAIGWDSYNNTGRGYIQGRFRGPSLVYGELEYRYPITKNGLISGTAFINGTTISNPDDNLKLYSNVAPAGGVGLRLKLNKATRSNLRIDFAVGRQSTGIYLNVAEAF